MSNETVDIGGQTLKELDDQGSRLTRIEEGNEKSSFQSVNSNINYRIGQYLQIAW